MLKLYNITKYIKNKFKRIILFAFLLAVKLFFFNVHGIYDYPHIPEDAIDSVLYKQAIPSAFMKDRPNCTYKHVLQNTHTINTWEVPKNYDDFDAAGIVNGSFSPEHCNPVFSVAILVTYRNRQEQLNIFLPYMHNFLRVQDIHYKIYVIEQRDDKPFNKGLLYNLGARAAIAGGFPCLILHDVDLLPLDDSNLYACTHLPRHISASIDKLRFVLMYKQLVGGVLAIRTDQYVQLNGFSHKFLNWGGEDDDMYRRMKEQDMKVIRFPRTMSRYTMLPHTPTPVNPRRRAQVAANRRDSAAARRRDGFRATGAIRAHRRDQRLFTLIYVET